MKPLIVTVTGPSSAGKTELSKDLSQHGFEPLVSTTTRLPRTGETDGRDYHFISYDAFQALKTSNQLIESVEYDGNCYGISSAEAERAFALGKPAVLVAEPHGVAQIAEYCHARGWEVLRVFVNNPTSVLLERMLNRVHQDTRDLDLQVDRLERQLEGGVWGGNARAERDDLTAQLHHAQGLIAKRLKAHANRIDKVLGFEQVDWVSKARSGEAQYELFVEQFDAGNRAQVLQEVLAVAEQFRQEPPAPAARRPKM